MAPGAWISLHNGEAVPRSAIPVLDVVAWRDAVLDGVGRGDRLAALFGRALDSGGVELVAVLGRPGSATLGVCATEVGDAYAALTPACAQAHWFEREIAEQFGVRPDGHPWLKPIRFHRSYRAARGSSSLASNTPHPGVTDFFRVQGDAVHEVAVGPVHAGVIEPGHFRFQCDGEVVLHLEIALGYQHRGVERALEGGPTKRTLAVMETVAGDTSVGHALAYCEATEALGDAGVSVRAQGLRGIALELERMANHTGDLGALAGDVGYLPVAAYCGRIRGDLLNLTALLCGSRFGRGLIRPGGVCFDVDAARRGELSERLGTVMADLEAAVALLWSTPSVQARFEGTGVVRGGDCETLGLVGPVARACGLDRDVRQEFPAGIFRFAQIPVSTCESGDVFARAYVRWLEMQRSAAFVREQLDGLADGPVCAAVGAPAANHFAVALVEGWRGEICHAVMTDGDGRFARYKIVDPSFHNWPGLTLALRNQAISDFPLCNKSFNLSYCGHDL